MGTGKIPSREPTALRSTLRSHEFRPQGTWGEQNNPVANFCFLLNPRIYLLKGANLRFKGQYHCKDKYKPPF